MKIQTLKKMILLGVMAVLTSISAHAQAGKQFTVTIPFTFSVSGKTLPAGQYRVGRSTQTTADGLVLSSTKGRGGVFVMTRGIQTPEIQKESKMVFRRYGDQYFLGEVWIAGTIVGRELTNSRKERQVARDFAKHGANSQKVSVLEDKR